MKKLIVIALLLPLTSFASFDANLKYGDKGDSVVELQEFLINDGCLNAQVSGNFYSLTQRAVKCFQSKNNLPVTGYFGPLSRAIASQQIATATEEIIATSTVTVISQANPQPTYQPITQTVYMQPEPVAPTPQPVVGTVAPVVPKTTPYAFGVQRIYEITQTEPWKKIVLTYESDGKPELKNTFICDKNTQYAAIEGTITIENNTITIEVPEQKSGTYIVKSTIAGELGSHLTVTDGTNSQTMKK